VAAWAAVGIIIARTGNAATSRRCAMRMRPPLIEVAPGE
jgi:hypothetical protein